MKDLLKHFTLASLFISFLLSSCILLTPKALSGYTIYTRITSINLPPKIIYRENYPNQTFFEFNGSAEIINPSDKTLFVVSHSTCLIFYAGFLSFENETYGGSILGLHYCGEMFTNYSFPSGIIGRYIQFELSVNNTLSSLPNGIFTIWIFLDDCYELHSYVHFSSIITVNDSKICIVHSGTNETFNFPTRTIPTPTNTASLSISFSYFLGVLLIIVKKHKNKN